MRDTSRTPESPEVFMKVQRNPFLFFASRTVTALAAALLFLPSPAEAGEPHVSNVQARQRSDKKVEVTYILSNAPIGGATVSIKFSEDGGSTYTITPAAGTLSGAVGTGIGNGSHTIVWDAPSTLPAEFYKTTMRAAVTAIDPGGGGGGTITITLPGGVNMELVHIPAGTFLMGSPTDERGRQDDEILHQVTLTQGYYIGKYEVTQAQWQAVMGSNPSWFKSCGGDCPVEHVSWDDICGGTTGSDCTASSFIGKLNAYLGTTKFRLPTEAEWERAARAGTEGPFSFDTSGNPNWDTGCGSFPEAEPYMWWCNNSSSQTHRVGSKQPNGYGLYDIHGNVWEWVADWYDSFSSMPVTDPEGPSSGAARVKRGGRYNYYARKARCAERSVDYPHVRKNWIGFRLARSE